MEHELEKMTLKQLRAFERKFVIEKDKKINSHFRNIFSERCTPDLKEYISNCKFEDTINYSLVLYVNDAIGKYTLQYKSVSFFTFNDPANEWKFVGEPLDYQVYTPGNYQLYLNEENIYLLRTMIPLALFLWNRYRIYVHSKPMDDGHIDLTFLPMEVATESYFYTLSQKCSSFLLENPSFSFLSASSSSSDSVSSSSGSSISDDSFYERLRKRFSFYGNS